MRRLDFFQDEWVFFLDHCDFTDVELQIISLVRRGWRLADIAAELFLSESTVKRYRKRIENKILHCILVYKFTE